jgi:hypothetical protein
MYVTVTRKNIKILTTSRYFLEKAIEQMAEMG